MRKLPPIAVSGLCLLLVGCQTPLFSDGLFGSFTPNRPLTTQRTSSGTRQTASTAKSRIGGRGWRNAATREAEKKTQAPATSINNVGRLREFLAKGNDAMQKGMYDDARIQYETVLSIEPRHATAHHMLGRVNDIAKNFEEAEQHYLQALSANREDGYLLSDLGYSYLQQGRLAEARRYLMQAVSREPDLVKAKINMAAVYAYAGDQRGALAWLNQVGTAQQAQETLAEILSKPAPYVFNGAAGALASNDKYTVSKDGQVLDENGNALTTFEQIKEAMDSMKQAARRKQSYDRQVQTYREDERIRGALGQQAFGGSRAGNGALDGSRLNDQMQAIEHESGSNQRSSGNTQPLYVGPPRQNNAPGQNSGSGQRPADFANGANGALPIHGQGQATQVRQQDPYSGLLNPAGPVGFQGQPGSLIQQVPPGQSGLQIPATTPQFPGQMQANPQRHMTIPQPSQQQQQQQIPNPNYGSIQGQQLPTQQNGNGSLQGTSSASPGYPGHMQRIDQTQRAQYGDPMQRLPQQEFSPNGQTRSLQSTPGSTAPNPAFYGQGNGQGSVNPQTGMNLGNHQQPIQQPIQQLGFDSQQPMARIDRGQRIQQYTEADRRAMQLGMAAGFGALSPIHASLGQRPQQGRTTQNNGSQNPARQNIAPQNNGFQNKVLKNNGLQRDLNGVPTNPGFDNRQQPYQTPQQGQQLQDRGSPGSLQGPTGQFPGQANTWPLDAQNPNTPINGQTGVEQVGYNPQTVQSWLNMPTSQAGNTMPIPFSSTTQPAQQQSLNRSQPGQLNSAWQPGGPLSSPTTRSEFGQPHMTNPHLRPANNQAGQASDAQTVQTASWLNRAP
jgi:Flp pilus assembly protein TadD